MAIFIVKVAFSTLLALVLGFFGLSLLFSDLSPGESLTSRLAIAVLFFFLSALVIGYFNPETWLLAVLVAWGGALLGIVGLVNSLITSPEDATEPLLFLLISVCPALLGGYLSSRLSRKWLIYCFFHRR